MWHGDNVQRDMAPIVRDTVWQRVWHGQVSASLLPSDSCFPLLTIAGTTCNFAKLPEKCSVTVSKYSNAARFSRFKVCGVSLRFPAPPPLCWKVRDMAGGWDESVTRYSVLTAYPLHLLHTFTKCFQLSCFAPGSPPRPGTTHPSSRDIQTLAISCSLSHRRHRNIKQQVLSIFHFYKVYYHDYLVSCISCMSP